MYNVTQNQALNTESLQRMVPSIFTTSGSSKTSDKYVNIPTIEIVTALGKEGFLPVKAMQSGSRSHEKRMHTKHILRFRHLDAQVTEEGLYPELVLVNSHDGLSSYRLMAGVFRCVCLNGLISGDTYEQIRIKHQGDIIGNVIEGTYKVIDAANTMIESSRNMSLIQLSPEEKKIFAESVHELRFGDDDTGFKEAIKPEQFLKARRYQEVGKDDLFTVFNVAQENIIRGGLTGYAIDPEGRYRSRTTHDRYKKVTTREIKAIDQNTSLNRALWTMAEEMAKLKAAA